MNNRSMQRWISTVIGSLALASLAYADELGYTTQYNGQQTQVNDIQAATQVTLTIDDTISEISAYVSGGPASTKVRYAVYADDNGEPGALIVQSDAVSKGTAAGWVTIDIPDTLLSAGTYWLALSGNHNGLKYMYEAGTGQSRHIDHDAISDGFRDPWGASTESHQRRISIYAVCTQCNSGGLVAHWKLDEVSGSVAYDSSGNDHHGNLINTGGSPSWTSGRLDGALEFDGSDDYLSVPSLPDLAGSMTILAWVKATDVSGNQRILADDYANDGYALSLGGAGNGRLSFLNRGLTPYTLDTQAVIEAGVWHFVAAVHDENSHVRRIYVDGVLAAEDSGAYGGTWDTDSGLAGIGGEVDGASEGSSAWRFGGRLDDVRLYDKALTLAEIEDIRALASPLYRLIHWTEREPD